MDNRKKQRFGRYEILAELGRGAMGIVYKARDPKINRVVAVKTISLAGQEPEQEKEYRERFFREAEAAGRLSHPGIVTIFDVGEEPETHAPYIVMEYVQGQTMEKLLFSKEDHKLAPEEALQLALEVAEALDCAHGQGVVHRDVKPANILITRQGHAKIADFGVAKLSLANATASGRIFGTPAYMSPEQLNDEPIDGRSDLFSLGVILYTAVTGYKPFQGNSAMTVAFKVVNRDPVPATVLDNELPPGLDYIISRAIAKDRSQRYQRGMEVVFDIQELRAGREPWSKAKEHDGQGVLPGPNETAAGLRSPTVMLSRAASISRRHENRALAQLFEKMRSRYFVGGVLLAGVLVLAVRARQLMQSPQELPKNLATAKTPVSPPLAGGMSTVESMAPAISSAPGTLTPRKSGANIMPAPAATKVTRRKPQEVSPSASPALLEIEIDHKFAEAELSIWVDGRLSYTHALEGMDKKRLVVFHKVQGHEVHAMQVSAGKHLLRVQVSPNSGTEQAESIEGQFSSGAEKLLRVEFDKGGKMNLTLQ
jgi:eukaryotic-like serine/threonine-protein kinase